MSTSVLQSRVEKASEILTAKDYDFSSVVQKISKTLDLIGIDDSDLGVKILEAETTVFDDFQKSLLDSGPVTTKSNITVPSPEFTIARLKIAWEILKGNNPFEKKEEKKDLSSNLVIPKPIGQWSDLELLEAYGRNCPIDVEEQLRRQTRGRYAIIFTKDGEVDVERSLYMVRMARNQKTPATFTIQNEICKVFRIGEFPMDVFYECPIHSDILLVDGYCHECGKKWETDPNNYERNVFLRLISEKEDVNMRIYRTKDFDYLKSDFPKIFMEFEELKEEGKLPSLKRKLSKSREGDPFRVTGSHHSY